MRYAHTILAGTASKHSVAPAPAEPQREIAWGKTVGPSSFVAGELCSEGARLGTMWGSGWQRPGCMAATIRMCGLVVEGEVQKGKHLSALWGLGGRTDRTAERSVRAVRPRSLCLSAPVHAPW